MIELLRTNDPVTLNFIEVSLRDAGIAHLVLDRNMSVIEGSIGILPRRVMVQADDLDEARDIMRDAGLAAELPERKPS
ncbi:Putative signal transducing protein [Pseudoxanthobacter soli DSM 19599]|uniref:Putative signal transducing protein n=1 Tax=Pseudoxanthobacter soli DSM 19599 TaxID=1123029 RepID=A0A1M7Z452_9HYPH|nr:DUF2007 domain-containing protein [Pseudoxanthobacter soli]SHO59661.1 Putative signal transducing protein [Pseudoxanthobacter soli DSM 19599]